MGGLARGLYSLCFVFDFGPLLYQEQHIIGHDSESCIFLTWIAIDPYPFVKGIELQAHVKFEFAKIHLEPLD